MCYKLSFITGGVVSSSRPCEPSSPAILLIWHEEGGHEAGGKSCLANEGNKRGMAKWASVDGLVLGQLGCVKAAASFVRSERGALFGRPTCGLCEGRGIRGHRPTRPRRIDIPPRTRSHGIILYSCSCSCTAGSKQCVKRGDV